MTTLNVNVVSSNGRSLVTVVGSGPAGVSGVGVPVGGTAGQLLSKIDATNFNTQWIPVPITQTRMGSATVAADQAGITTLVDLTSFTVTFTAVAGHVYLVFYVLGATQLTATGTQTFRLSDGASDLGIIDTKASVLAAGFNMVSGFAIVSGLSAGAHTLKLRGTTSAGTMTISSAGAVNGRFAVLDTGV